MDWLFQLAPPAVLMLALNVIGLAIKRSPLPDWVIVWVLPAIGGLAYPFVAGVGGAAGDATANHSIPLNILYGVVIGGGAVWGNQLLRQTLAIIVARQNAMPTEPKP